MDGVVRKDWREAVVDGKGKVERIPYELCVLVARRDAIRRREIYVEGGRRWGDPEDGRPAWRLRVGPHRALRRALPAREPQGVRHRPETADDRRLGPAVGGARGRLGGRGEGHQPQGRAVDHRAEAGAAGRAHGPWLGWYRPARAVAGVRSLHYGAAVDADGQE
ncbi:hypothetical protein HTV45_30775 [Streptomyces sp. CHD11]|uniref:hypothetical protein n=1 Tax=Streptomyces sp. CHD11 TaxID=2741325 RepID=UPI001BFCCF2F|nr:hypothetical protein [Streptomyces sp. CHD11]MBT3155203.1 hypothetical protein [Streptomyces sp. CHD11]